MRVISASKELQTEISTIKRSGKSIGFVPTMGALHKGHLSLIDKAIENNDIVVISIFVNPLQFNSESDLKTYPRVLNEDLRVLEHRKVDIVFTPSEEDLYPSKPRITINFGKMSKVLEGKYRKGHFEGVGIIVAKLLHLVHPDHAFFGLKDLQQFLLIRRMSEDLSFQTRIVGVETVREKSGLAMSSRNRKLSGEGLEVATVISKGLNIIKEGIKSNASLEIVLKEARRVYTNESGFRLEYLEAVDPRNLRSVSDYSKLNELAVCVAGYVENIRLIDNLYLRLK